MNYYGNYITKLIEQLSSLPGIGGKSAQRLAFHIINMPSEKARALAEAIVEAKENVKYCSKCCTLTDSEICPICADKDRNHKVIMVVENSRDLAAYERTREFKGIYHVLHGAISPMTGVGPQDIKIKELLTRIKEEEPEEIPETLSSATGDLWEEWHGAKTDWEGEGTRKNPYKITNLSELMGLSESV